MNILFMGTSQFSKQCLEEIEKSGYNVVCCFCQPDKSVGRGNKIIYSSVKQYCIDNCIKFHQPNKISENQWVDLIGEIKPDLIVTASFGQILPEQILNIPKYGCINVHTSLLPKYRGSSPIQTARLNGDKQTGVTIMYMDKGLDTGDIILQEKMDIKDSDTSADLFVNLSVLSRKALSKALQLIFSENVNPIKQNLEEATTTSMLTKNMGEIDFDKDAIEIHNLIMALNPWPIAYTFFNGKKMKVFKSRVVDLNCESYRSGLILSDKNFYISCNNNTCIEFLEVLLEGGKKVDGKSFIVSRNIKKGNDIFKR